MKRALIALSLVSALSVACTAEFSSNGNPKVVAEAGDSGEAGNPVAPAAGTGGSSGRAGAPSAQAGTGGVAGRSVVAGTGGDATAGESGAAGSEAGAPSAGGAPQAAAGTGGGGTAAAAGLGGGGSGGAAAGSGGSDAGTGGAAVTPPSCTAKEALKISALPTTFELPAWSESSGAECFVANAGSCSFAVAKFGPYEDNQDAGSLLLSSVVCDTSPRAGACGAEKACGGAFNLPSASGLPFDNIVPDGDGYRLTGFVVSDQFGTTNVGSCSYPVGDGFQHAFQQAIADMLGATRFPCH